MQYYLSAMDLNLVLTLVRSGSLAGASESLGIDNSTVFRQLQRMERGIGQTLFDRSQKGCLPTELALKLVSVAESIESKLDAAQKIAQASPDRISGTVRISTTDTVLQGFITPILGELYQQHTELRLDIDTNNRFADLTRRNVDIALRATKTPPQHLVGKCLGAINYAVYASYSIPSIISWNGDLNAFVWIAPDEALPQHPTVLWRRKHLPKIRPQYFVDSILSVADMIEQGLGVGMLPVFLERNRPQLKRVSEFIDYSSQLWLLAHPESRHLRRISAVYRYFSDNLRLEN